jgi:hypothetical protein
MFCLAYTIAAHATNNSSMFCVTAAMSAIGCQQLSKPLLDSYQPPGSTSSWERDMGINPLHCAAAACNATAVQQLLQRGLDPNLPSSCGLSALHFAVLGLRPSQPAVNTSAAAAEVCGTADQQQQKLNSFGDLIFACMGGLYQLYVGYSREGETPSCCILSSVT